MIWRILAMVGLITAVGCSAQPTTSAQPKTSAKVITVEKIRSLKEVRAGRASQILFTLRNDGDAASDTVMLHIGSEYFDGFILRSATPKPLKDDKGGDFRTIRFAGLQPGEEQPYAIDLQANKPGDYKFWGYVSVGASQEVSKWSDRAVIIR